MKKRYTITETVIMAALVLVAAAFWSGCERRQVGSPFVPNALPDTRVGGETPVPLESGFLVHFDWGGSDPDGEVVGFQWKLVPVGSDGISVPDTLTEDPDTGQLINPWHFTTTADSVFVISAAPQPAGDKLTIAYVFLVRSVDSDDGVDPTPAQICFTASTLLPTIFVDRPEGLHGYNDAQPLPPTVRFGWTGTDPDFPSGIPTKVRYLWKRALLNDHYVGTAYEYNQHVEELSSFADSAWSDWLPYASDPEERVITFPNQPMTDSEGRHILYLFVIQAMDTTGAVSVDRIYAQNVHNIYITQSMTPLLTVYEPNLGVEQAFGINSVVVHDIVPGQPLNFSWLATAEAYFGTITAYRYGWDIVDPDDENDPGWAVTPGISPEHLYTPERSFSSGNHILIIQCWDDFDQMTRITYQLNVVPVPDPSAQLPLLLVDDVMDRNSNGWPAADMVTPLDNDVYRDAFWEDVLAGSGGVMDFVPARDVVDTEVENLTFRDLVNYKSVLWTTRFTVGNFIWNTFKPMPDGSQGFNWLDAYQQWVGNVFMAGSRSMNEFIKERNWMIPWVFDTDELLHECGGQSYTVGFGTEQLPDGTVVDRGPLRYPYRTMGIAMLDQVTPHYNIYGECGLGSSGNNARSAACVGVKGLLLDTDFATTHGLAGVFPDTIYTDSSIDWKDLSADYRDNLNPYTWGNDEFYDGNITERQTIWSPQDCDGTPCLEPMFSIYSRFDWVDDLHVADGDPDWPHNIFDPEELTTTCGQHALDGTGDESRTTGHTLGFVSHKYDVTKPSGVGDVLWGFDPYRFDHGEVTDAIQWVLGEHFGLVMRP